MIPATLLAALLLPSAALVLPVVDLGEVGVGVLQIDIVAFVYQPRVDVVLAGQTVTWTNFDDSIHDAADILGSWNAGDMGQGESRSVTFAGPGAYVYICTYHSSMIAALVVLPALPGA